MLRKSTDKYLKHWKIFEKTLKPESNYLPVNLAL